MKTLERARALKFLRSHVIGKAVAAAPITTQSDGDAITAAYEEDAVFSSLVESADGFSFDMTTLARGTRYVRGKRGQVLVAEGTMNAVRVVRYEMTERRSSGHLVGFSRFVSSTNTEPDPFSGAIFLVRMWPKNTGLQVDEALMGYADFVSEKGTFQPMAVEGTYQYALERGKLVVRYQQATFSVDTKTLKRTRTRDKFPVQVSREVEFPSRLEEIP